MPVCTFSDSLWGLSLWLYLALTQLGHRQLSAAAMESMYVCISVQVSRPMLTHSKAGRRTGSTARVMDVPVHEEQRKREPMYWPSADHRRMLEDGEKVARKTRLFLTFLHRTQLLLAWSFRNCKKLSNDWLKVCAKFVRISAVRIMKSQTRQAKKEGRPSHSQIWTSWGDCETRNKLQQFIARRQ